MLEEDFYFKHKTNIKFSSILNNIITHNAVKWFQNYIRNTTKYQDHIYCCYTCFVNPAQLNYIFEKDIIIIAVLNIVIWYHHNIDYFGDDFKSFDFYYKC